MHLKSCCVLFLLALVACQAAPSTFKNIEKKSISEKTSKIEKDDLKMEEPGMDKNRAKKSATTFCVEVRDGTRQEVPCSETKQPIVMIQPEPPKQTVIRQIPVYYQHEPIKFSESQPPIQVIHTQPQQPQPIQTVQVQSQPQPAPTAPSMIVMPPSPTYNIPAVQTPLPQQVPIVNILTPPAAPCNLPPTIIQHEHIHEPIREVEHLKPILKPEQPEPELKPKPMPSPHPVELVPIAEPASCKQDVVVLPSKPITVYPEKQLAVQVTELEPRPVSGTECICNQRGRSHPWFRHHPKVHEHHVMVHPTANVAPATPLVVQPLSYLSDNRPIIVGQYPTNSDMIISVHQGHTHYPIYSNMRPSTSLGYIPYPVKTYDSQPYVSPSVTVNAFPRTDATGIFRQAQSNPQKLMENNELEKAHPIVRQMIDAPTSGTNKREADSIQLEKNQQINIAQERAVESGKTPVEMKFGEQNSTM